MPLVVVTYRQSKTYNKLIYYLYIIILLIVSFYENIENGDELNIEIKIISVIFISFKI